MDEKSSRRRRPRPKTVARLDQLEALLRDRRCLMSTTEIARIASEYYSDTFRLLQTLHDQGRVIKVKDPMNRLVFWGLPGAELSREATVSFELARQERVRQAVWIIGLLEQGNPAAALEALRGTQPSGGAPGSPSD